MALRDLLSGRRFEEAAERAEKVVDSSEKLCKAIESAEKKMDTLIEALNRHSEVMMDVAKALRGQ